jgi:hypothetical protein
MAIALVNTRTYDAAQTAATPVRTVIPTCTAGDLLVVVWNCVGNPGSPIASTSTGWNVVEEVTQTDNTYAVMLAKIATGTDVTNIGTTQQIATLGANTGTTQVCSASASYSGVDTSSTVSNAIIASSFTHSAAGANPISSGSATNTDANAWAVCGFTAARGSGGTAGSWAATGLTTRVHAVESSSLTTNAAILDSNGGVATGSRSYSGTHSGFTPTRTNGFIALLKPQVNPSTGTLSTSIDVPTVAFAGSRVMPDGPLSTSIDVPTVAFTGVAAPPTGTLGTSIDVPTVTFNGVVAAGGPLSTSIDVPAFSGVGAVNPIGAFSTSIDVPTVAFVGETVPFGEHVIVVEAEHRAFRVLDDEPGLIPIKRSQVSNL